MSLVDWLRSKLPKGKREKGEEPGAKYRALATDSTFVSAGDLIDRSRGARRRDVLPASAWRLKRARRRIARASKRGNR